MFERIYDTHKFHFIEFNNDIEAFGPWTASSIADHVEIREGSCSEASPTLQLHSMALTASCRLVSSIPRPLHVCPGFGGPLEHSSFFTLRGCHHQPKRSCAASLAAGFCCWSFHAFWQLCWPVIQHARYCRRALGCCLLRLVGVLQCLLGSCDSVCIRCRGAGM